MFRLFHGLSWFSLGDLGVAAQSLRLEHTIDRKEQYFNTVDVELNVFVCHEAQSQYIWVNNSMQHNGHSASLYSPQNKSPWILSRLIRVHICKLSNSISPDGRSFLPFIMDKVIRPPLVCLVSDQKHLIQFATVLTYIVCAQLVRYNNCRSDLLPDCSHYHCSMGSTTFHRDYPSYHSAALHPVRGVASHILVSTVRIPDGPPALD